MHICFRGLHYSRGKLFLHVVKCKYKRRVYKFHNNNNKCKSTSYNKATQNIILFNESKIDAW